MAGEISPSPLRIESGESSPLPPPHRGSMALARGSITPPFPSGILLRPRLSHLWSSRDPARAAAAGKFLGFRACPVRSLGFHTRPTRSVGSHTAPARSPRMSGEVHGETQSGNKFLRKKSRKKLRDAL